MKRTINTTDFKREIAGHGFFRISYTSPITNKTWTRVAPVYVWEDVMEREDKEPTKAQLNALKNYIKNCA